MKYDETQCPPDDRIDVQEVVRVLREKYGLDATLASSGGNVMTIYVGPLHESELYRAIAGPCFRDGSHVFAYASDFYIGPDGDSEGGTSEQATTQRKCSPSWSTA